MCVWYGLFLSTYFTIQLIFAIIHGSHCIFDTIHGSYCTISANFYFYLQYFHVNQKLAGWKANLLSFAGRKVLIQATTYAIPSYVMQTNFLPSRLLDNLDRLNRNFLWGFSEPKRRMHWVVWEKITQPLDKGGLGLQTAKGRNLAYLSKLNWRFHAEKDSFWARVLRKKYMTQRRMSSSKENSLPSSRTWKAMKKGMDVFNRGTR